jgi:hypothetical protein
MFRLLCVLSICLATVPAFCQSASDYQVATIVDVKIHQSPDSDASDPARYDVSLKVGHTIYLVLYTPPFGLDTVKHKIGQNLLVLPGKNTITYNNILGEPQEVPIIRQKRANDAKPSE